MDQNNYMQQMMRENTKIVKDETTVHDDSWRFDEQTGVMVSVVKFTQDKMVEMTPLAVKQIIQSWNQAIQQGDVFRRMFDLVSNSDMKLNNQESEILDQWRQVIDNADKAAKYLQVNKPQMDNMEKWLKSQEDKQKAEIEAGKQDTAKENDVVEAEPTEAEPVKTDTPTPKDV